MQSKMKNSSTRFALGLSALFLTALTLGAAALAPAARAQAAPPNITYVTVDYPGAVTTSAVDGINDFNEIVGIYDDASGNMHSFAGQAGNSHYTNIDYPGATQTYVFRINNWGEIVGTYFDKAGYQHGFVRLPSLFGFLPPVYLSIDVPGAAKTQGIDYELGTGLGTSAFGLNNWGEITGQYADKQGVGHGFLLSCNGFTAYTAQNANQVPGFLGGSALSDINDYEEAAGEYAGPAPFAPPYLHGFFLSGGKQTTFDPPGSVLTQVFGINNRHEISGFYYDGPTPEQPGIDGLGIGHGYILSKGKYLIIDVPGAVFVSTVGSVNNVGKFVGEFVDGVGVTHGYIATRH